MRQIGRLRLLRKGAVWRYGSYLLGLAGIALLWPAVFLIDRMATRDAYNQQVNELNDDARLFEENILRSISEVDKTLLYLRRHIEQNVDVVDYRKLVTQDDVLSEIIVQVAIIDASGMMRASSADPNAKQVNLSDREHFKIHVNSASDILFMSTPIVGRVSNKWSVQFTRRLRGRTGEFAGVVVASLDPAHFTSLYSSLHSGHHGGITLLGLDGVVRATGGATSVALGKSLRDRPIMSEVMKGDDGVFRNSDDGATRVGAFRKVRGYPLAVLVDINEVEMLAHVSWQFKRNVAMALILTVVLLVVSEWGARYQHRLRIAQLRLARSRRRAVDKSEQLSLTLDSMTHGILMVTKDMRIPILNRQAMALLDLPSHMGARGVRFEDIVDHLIAQGDIAKHAIPEGMTPVQFVLQRQSDGGFKTYERVRPNGTVLEIRTTELVDGGFVRTITDITDRRRAQEVITRMAEEDALTGLANRRTFQAQLNSVCAAYASGGVRKFAVFYLDLDRFKTVNDTLGHPAGDELLKAVADRLRHTLRVGDLVARLGGDEFAIIAETTENDKEVAAIAKRVTALLSQPFDLCGKRLEISTSVGVARAPLDGTDANMLLKAADTALYAAKAAGRNTHMVFEAGMMEEIRVKREIETDLRAAITSGDQLTLNYQPLLELSTDTIVGFEALMRWRHPEKGNVPPSVFIAVAEETGLIVELGTWAIETACREAVQWSNEVRVAVNVSTHQFRSDNLVDIVEAALEVSGLKADRLELEITESILMENDNITKATLHRLRDLGVRISMDDFGTGYSSLSYLRSFPLSKIKIDRSFISDVCVGEDCAVIVRSIVAIARTLGMSVTAEGVETGEQMARLRALGCDEIQGYLISKPSPASDVPALIMRWQPLLSRTA